MELPIFGKYSKYFITFKLHPTVNIVVEWGLKYSTFKLYQVVFVVKLFIFSKLYHNAYSLCVCPAQATMYP